jgi:hypothetical protein
MPSRSAIAATSFAVSFPSEGFSTVEPWIARKAATSSSAICDGPSSPVETPACEPVGFANSGGFVFMDESAEEIPTL